MVKAIPEHLRTVTPRLVVRDGAAAMDFYARAFGAEAVGEPFTGPGGELIHAEMRIGDSIIMLTDDSDSTAQALNDFVTAMMSTYWEDVDSAWARAVEAGAEIIYPLDDQFYGERGGRLRDPFGQQWTMSQHVEDVSSEEMERRAATYFGSSPSE